MLGYHYKKFFFSQLHSTLTFFKSTHSLDWKDANFSFTFSLVKKCNRLTNISWPNIMWHQLAMITRRYHKCKWNEIISVKESPHLWKNHLHEIYDWFVYFLQYKFTITLMSELFSFSFVRFPFYSYQIKISKITVM